MTAFFDSNCSLGSPGIPMPGAVFTAPELLAEMDYMGIGQALVYHAWAREYSPAVGNARLMEEIAGHERLVACWVVMPHHTGEMPLPAALLAGMRQQGAKAARIFPARTTHNWSLAPWSSGDLFGALEDARCPAFVSYDQVSWDGIAALCHSFPQLPIVVTEARYTEYRTLYPLLDRCRNLFVELCWMPVHWGIEAAVTRFGPERFLFGTNMPVFTAGPAINHLVYSALSPGEVAQIAGGNLCRLLDWS